jgi:probable F420-dependent oxidoreductase
VQRRIPASRGCARLGAVKIGLAALGIGRGARPATLQAVARTADATGFMTLWMGQHVVLFDRHDSRYPYSERGEFTVPATTDWLDPLVTLSAAATITSRIRLATGICLVPQHNPLILAKQVASLDRLSDGRFVFGIGIGWLAEEFAALGIPFARRAERTREYVALMRRLWSEEVTTFHGEFASVDGVRSFPKPVQGGRLPVILGGESRAALTRGSPCSGACCSAAGAIPRRSRSWWRRSRSRSVPRTSPAIMRRASTRSRSWRPLPWTRAG